MVGSRGFAEIRSATCSKLALNHGIVRTATAAADDPYFYRDHLDRVFDHAARAGRPR